MDIETFRLYCLSKKDTEETQPFGPDALVYKVNGKVFAITNLRNEEFKVNLKCDPNYAIELREQHEDIIPGWHMNKKHWNTVAMQGTLKLSFLKELIDHSYQLVSAQHTRGKKKKP